VICNRMTDPDLSFLTLPLRIIPHQESYEIVDGEGRAVCFVYYEAKVTRRQVMGRLAPDDALVMAQFVARALADAAEDRFER
jgi:hypothetical protein